MKKENRKFASEDILAIEELAEQLASELDVDDDIEQVEDETADAVPIVEDQTPDEVIAAAEELLADAELPDEKEIIGDHDVLCRTAQCIFYGHQIITWNVQQLENGPLNALQTVLFFCTQHLLHPLIIPFATGFKFFQCLQTTFRLHELLNSLLRLLLLPL